MITYKDFMINEKRFDLLTIKELEKICKHKTHIIIKSCFNLASYNIHEIISIYNKIKNVILYNVNFKGDIMLENI